MVHLLGQVNKEDRLEKIAIKTISRRFSVKKFPQKWEIKLKLF